MMIYGRTLWTKHLEDAQKYDKNTDSPHLYKSLKINLFNIILLLNYMPSYP